LIQREYGRTGKRCSILGFGGMRFQKPEDPETCARMMVEAAQGGVNYFDTAPAYFGVKSELAFGQGFRELRRLGLPFYCATKTFQASEMGIRKEIEKQLQRLGLEAIDFYHVWSVVTLENWRERKAKGVVQAFRRLKEEGLVRHIAVSSHLLGDQIVELLSEELFEGVLFGYSAYNFPAREKAFQAIASRALGCVVMNPLGGGLIPQNPDLFDFLRREPGQDIVEAALHFLFAHEHITTALVGFGTLGEVQQALRAAHSFRGLPEGEIRRIKGSLGDAFQELCTGCQYCDHCPEGIPVPRLMEAFNHWKLRGKPGREPGTPAAALERLKWHWSVPVSEAGRCTACGRCEKDCTQHLPIVERLRQLSALAAPAK
jgi:predicted aldo/keto reductase-like oxidoreductase